MKKQVSRMLVVGLALAASATVYAQTSTTLLADIPFAFSAAGKSMPAGSYHVNQTANGAITWLAGPHATSGFTTVPLSDEPKTGRSRLVFQCYGSECFLKEIWPGGSSMGSHLRISRRERELAQRNVPARLAVIHVALQ